MLVLSRKPSQQILVGSEIRITVVRIDRNQVRLGIQAPPGIPILRNELTEKPPMVVDHSSWNRSGSPPEAGLAGERKAQPSRKRAAKAGSPTPTTHHS
jgi:carbon storage regulator